MADAAFPLPTAPFLNLAPTAGRHGLLRFTTAGSVDDGKSTLIGRLLYDSKTVYEDQLDSVRKSRINRSSGPVDFSLLTDGLRAEREQGITIDVAYRYFSTPRRRFIIADTPGHEQYTRNMATGASTADAAIVLIDATKGLLPQSRRHAYIASLLGICYTVAAVNKMDLIGYDESTYRRIARDFERLANQLGLTDVYVLPISALEGDNVVRRSARMPWFDGPALLDHLENLPLVQELQDAPVRFPVQYVIRPDSSFRGFGGQVASGTLRAGATLVALSSGTKTRVRAIVAYDGGREEARAGESTTITLAREIDLSRGDLLVSEAHPPSLSRRLRTNLVWMHGESLNPKKLYLLKHTTRVVRARVTQILYRVDVGSLEHFPASTLAMNDIAAVEIETTLPLFFDAYRVNRTMGSFILIDPISNATVAAGMIESASDEHLSGRTGLDGPISAEERKRRLGHPAAAIWISNGHDVAEQIERKLFDDGWHVQLVSSADLSTSELIGAVKALRLSGAIAIMSVSDAETAQQETIRGLYGPDSFFNVGEMAPSHADSTTRLMSALRNWRDARAEKTKGGA